MAKTLPAKQRSELRAQAHKLSPVVIVGDKGLTDEVLAEIDRSLRAHELIKIRAATDEREARAAWMEAICEKLAAHEVQQIGKILVVYRENPEAGKPKPKRDPGPAPRKRGGRDDAGVKGTSRPRSRTSSPLPESGPRRRRPRTSR